MKPLTHLICAGISAYLSVWLSCYVIHVITFPEWTVIPGFVTMFVSAGLHMANIAWAHERLVYQKPTAGAE